MILEQLNVYGWPQRDENLLLATLLTGDPLLLIGRHGCAKTYLAAQVAGALGRRFVAYDASKAMFEDVLGYPNLEQLKRGRVEYVPGPLTVWDKEMLLIDELNRALPELQSKWLELIRSRRIMGLPTQLKWVWAAMNPPTYAGTQALDSALLGRFALFVYPPEALEMAETDRIKVTETLAADDAPALGVWLEESATAQHLRVQRALTDTGSISLTAVLRRAARHYADLQADLAQLPLFLCRLAELAHRESQGQITLDGRRLGFLYRGILANRAMELARAGSNGKIPLPSLAESVRYVLSSGIPLGLDEGLLDTERARHCLELCFDLLSDFLEPGSELSRLDAIYELCTTRDLRRKVELLLEADLGELARCRGWQSIAGDDGDVTTLAYIALLVEARHPGRIPTEILSGLCERVAPARLATQTLPPLVGEDVEYLDEIESLVRGAGTELETAVALDHVRKLIEAGDVSRERIVETEEAIAIDLAWLESVMARNERR